METENPGPLWFVFPFTWSNDRINAIMVIIKSQSGVIEMSLPNEERKYTYADYLSWTEDKRIELIDGNLYLQASPSRIHQKVLSELHRQIANYLVGEECEVYPAPFHVVLDLDEKLEDEK